MKNFTDIKDISKGDIEDILTRTKNEKISIKENGIQSIEKILLGKTVALVFEKPSTRTRVSFEVGISQQGGSTSVLQSSDIQLSRGETVADTAKVLSKYVDLIVVRCFKHQTMIDFSNNSSVPVVNGLTDQSHPCQVIADILTIEENKGHLSKQNLLWIGDGNNVARSWLEASKLTNLNLTICTPENLSLPNDLIESSVKDGVNLLVDNDPNTAIRNKSVIITDTWNSMGDGSVNKENSLMPYQVNKNLMSKARKDAVFMHCLPAHRGCEVTEEVIDSKQSLVFEGAENRLHVQRSIIWWCLNSD
ncbi:MAG: ornithine carbamoyltransferase [SAR116 cluster bacterium]|nr:ornithine carbamoyltransferase [SAR116 cluster bacterium]